MEKAYAEALWKAVSGGMEPKKAVLSLRDMLAAGGRASLYPRIARAFARIAARESNRTGITLTVAREADLRHAESEAKKILKEEGIEASDLKTRVDDTLIGGWRLEGAGMLVDKSYKKNLLDIYKLAVKA